MQHDIATGGTPRSGSCDMKDLAGPTGQEAEEEADNSRQVGQLDKKWQQYILLYCIKTE